MKFLHLSTYTPPLWASSVPQVPAHRVSLCMAPTPIHPWALPGLPEGVQVWVKRDDMTGSSLSGNKVRKLEFLLADALKSGADSAITIGGIQSNHCRATAMAARYLGLECHLILRTSRLLVDSDPGLVGNLMPERMAGAHVHLVSKEEYVQQGQYRLTEALAEQLKAQGSRPYVIPVGGSNALGVWGYLESVEEIRQQMAEVEGGFTDLAVAIGSGGTALGLALGNRLAGLGTKFTAYGVCDDPNYFYGFCDGLLEDMGMKGVDPDGSRGLMEVVQARGLGYALSTAEELRTVRDVAVATGVVLDPVYSGKAVHAMLAAMREKPEEWRGRRVLFVHTGGVLGMYDKLDQLQMEVESLERVHRLQLS